MKRMLIFYLVTIFITAHGQNTTNRDFTEEIKKYDISNLWTLDKFQIENDTETVERPEPLGYIGNNFQRFQIHFISVIKNADNKLQYFVYGKTKVKENICRFQGTITIIKAELYKDEEFPTLWQGVVRGEYVFYENPHHAGSGVLRGKFQTDFYINEKGEIKYNGLMAIADGFSNNQFEGTWTSYKTGVSKKCNWGDFRIPDSQKLDIGAGEFAPADEYLKNGWQNYIQAWGDNPEAIKARKKENEKWWIEH